MPTVGDMGRPALSTEAYGSGATPRVNNSSLPINTATVSGASNWWLRARLCRCSSIWYLSPTPFCLHPCRILRQSPWLESQALLAGADISAKPQRQPLLSFSLPSYPIFFSSLLMSDLWYSRIQVNFSFFSSWYLSLTVLDASCSGNHSQ